MHPSKWLQYWYSSLQRIGNYEMSSEVSCKRSFYILFIKNGIYTTRKRGVKMKLVRVDFCTCHKPQMYTWCTFDMYLMGAKINAHITIRVTSYSRLRARDHYTSSTLIGRNGGAGPSSLHNTLEGPMEYVNARWMYSLRGFLHDIEWIMFHGHLDYSQEPPLGGRLDTKPGDLGTPNAQNC